MSDSDKLPSRKADIAGFLDQVSRTPRQEPAARARLIFALDATASRQPTWDQAAELQAEMFRAVAALGGLEVQLCHYRGMGEFRAGDWSADSISLLEQMNRVRCLGGRTQIERVLRHALSRADERPPRAVVFIGDAVEEDVDRLCDLAGQLGLRRLPLFLFVEGQDPHAAWVFEQLARLSGGVCCPFDQRSAEQLRTLLSAVAVYAVGGRDALADYCQRQHLPASAPIRRMLTGPKGS